MGQNHTPVSSGSCRARLDAPRRRSQALRDAATRVELLEARRLLATVEGNVWFDEDNDALRDYFENPVPDLTIYIDANKNSQLDDGELTTTTDAKGFYEFTDLPVEPFDPETATGGTAYNVAHVPFIDVDGVSTPVSQTSPGVVGKSNVQSLFNIDIVYADNSLNDEQKTLVETAVGRWEQAIIGDLPAINGIDDLQITVIGGAVDGPGGVLAFAGPRAFRPPSGGQPGLPYTGEVTLDLVDSVASRGFVDVVIHEIGHVMGIGTVWDQFLINRGTAGVGFIGDNGLEEYERLFGVDAASVPVQPFVEGHWDASALALELMNPFSAGGFNLPPDAEPLMRFSRLTIGALEDIGYVVNYGASDTYGPFNIGPLPEDFNPDLGFVPFQITSFFKNESEIVDDANFGVRFNRKPDPFFFTVGPEIVAPSQPLRLLFELDSVSNAKTTGDSDYRDGVLQVNFYRETNGVDGVQTSVDVQRGSATSADELLFEDADFSDGIEVTVDTAGYELGEHTFYARAFDEGYFVRDAEAEVSVVAIQQVPAKPESLRAIGLDRANIQINWIDASTNENGFLLEVSESPNFDVPADITKIYLPAQDGTGAYTHELHVPEGELTTRHLRVRSFNTGGSSPFAGRVTARTLSRLEVLIDNEDVSRVRNLSNWETIVNRNASINLTYLRGTSGFVEYDPQRSESTDYFVFLNNPSISEAGRILVTVFAEDLPVDELTGEPIPFTKEIDQAANKGAEVQIGRFQFGPGSFVRIEHVSGTARVDTVRFLPVA